MSWKMRGLVLQRFSRKSQLVSVMPHWARAYRACMNTSTHRGKARHARPCNSSIGGWGMRGSLRPASSSVSLRLPERPLSKKIGRQQLKKTLNYPLVFIHKHVYTHV